MKSGMTRRNVIKTAAFSLIPVSLHSHNSLPVEKSEPFTFCLNTSTIRGQNLGIKKGISTWSYICFSGECNF